MTRLIDADMLKKRIEETKDEYFGLYQAIIAIDEAPTVDPEITEKQAILLLINNGWLVNHDKELREKWERPQGEWIEEAVPVGLVGRGNGQYRCSNCQHGDIHAKNQEVPFCWYCGADMRGEE